MKEEDLLKLNGTIHSFSIYLFAVKATLIPAVFISVDELHQFILISEIAGFRSSTYTHTNAWKMDVLLGNSKNLLGYLRKATTSVSKLPKAG